jgi:iron(II)-dependent oxidoreductase
LWLIHPWLFGLALIGVMGGAAYLGLRYLRRLPADRREPLGLESLLASHEEPPASTADEESGDLIEQMLRHGRYALLLRPQIVGNLEPAQVQRAMSLLDESMALVPEGDVVLRASHLDPSHDGDDAALLERAVRVEPLLLDRYPVTNRQYQAFVDAGGYEQISLWDPTVWPGILDFVDSTGHSGPRFWKDGKFPAGEGDHPVVGISWYEASAYARWVGKRLPSDPEWVKAGAWPVDVPGGKPLQRKHPWGDTMDRTQANLWGSGPGKTCSIHECNNGGTVGGVYQLVGNVWEWTTSNFGAWDPALRRLETPSQMKSIRGGAFDTYFDCQANCQFQSGDSPMARKHNIGFRCALGVCDLGPINGLNQGNSDAACDEADAELVSA